jgi:predicted DNA-binding transcriptional regulator AlpA
MGRSTSKVAKLLCTTARRLWLLIEREEIPSPQRINGVMFTWSDEDIERARVALAKRAAARTQKGAKGE